MSISLYSSATTDSLLSPKLSISSLSNAAATTLNATAPTTGQVLTYDGTELIWATGGGGGLFLPLAGGTMDASATIVLSDATYNSLVSGEVFGVELTADPTQNASLSFNALTIQDGVGTMQLSATALTFPDATIQTTAIVAGPAGANGLNGAMNYLDIVTMTSSSNPSYYESGGSWSMYYGFMNTSAGWFYGKLSGSGVDFKLYINGVYDNTVNAAYNYYYLSGTLVGVPVSGDVVTVFISDGTGEATFPILTYTY